MGPSLLSFPTFLAVLTDAGLTIPKNALNHGLTLMSFLLFGFLLFKIPLPKNQDFFVYMFSNNSNTLQAWRIWLLISKNHWLGLVCHNESIQWDGYSSTFITTGLRLAQFCTESTLFVNSFHQIPLMW